MNYNSTLPQSGNDFYRTDAMRPPINISSISSLEERRDCESDTCETGCITALSFVGNVIQTIFSTIYYVISSVIAWPFNFISDGIYHLFNPEQVDPQVLEVSRNYRIASARISDKPEKIDLEAILETNESANIPIQDLLIAFDRIMALEEMTNDRRRSLRSYIDHYVLFVSVGCHAYFSNEQICRDLKLIVQNIILNLNKDDSEVSHEKKVQVLEQLADASYNCGPRRYEEALRQLKYLTNHYASLDQDILSTLQGMKEDIILSQFQTSDQFHPLNHARQAIGEEWGLDNENSAAANDDYAWMFGSFACSYRAALRRNYTSARIIATVYEHLKLDKRTELINNFLQTENEEGRLGEDFDFTSLYENDSITISYAGVAFLLTRLGFLTEV